MKLQWTSQAYVNRSEAFGFEYYISFHVDGYYPNWRVKGDFSWKPLSPSSHAEQTAKNLCDIHATAIESAVNTETRHARREVLEELLKIKDPAFGLVTRHYITTELAKL